MSIGNAKGPKAPVSASAVKSRSKEPDFLAWDKDKVIEILKENILKLRKGSSSFKSITRIASTFLMTQKQFRKKCLNDDDIATIFNILNELYVESVIDKSIEKGSITSEVAKYLKDEVQAFTGTGLEQNIKWVVDSPKLVNIFGDEFEIEADVVKDDKNVQMKTLWEIEQEDINGDSK